jgi:hypothetical protein
MKGAQLTLKAEEKDQRELNVRQSRSTTLHVRDRRYFLLRYLRLPMQEAR